MPYKTGVTGLTIRIFPPYATAALAGSKLVNVVRTNIADYEDSSWPVRPFSGTSAEVGVVSRVKIWFFPSGWRLVSVVNDNRSAAVTVNDRVEHVSQKASYILLRI